MASPLAPPSPGLQPVENTYGLLAFMLAIGRGDTPESSFWGAGLPENPVQRSSAGVYFVRAPAVYAVEDIVPQLTLTGGNGGAGPVSCSLSQDANGSFVVSVFDKAGAPIDGTWALTVTRVSQGVNQGTGA